MYKDEKTTGNITQGSVFANDIEYARAYMLTHQIQRINTAGMMVINHAAQFFPTLYIDNKDSLQIDNKFYFDKILADVPCSGDGAMRKLPQKWRNWSPQEGISLHILQFQILMRAMQLVKVGGLVLYSTCSINPIEVFNI